MKINSPDKENESKLFSQKTTHQRTADEIEEWLINAIAQALEVEEDEIDPSIPFERYGLDSVAVIGLTGELDEWLDQRINPSLLYDYPTIDALVGHLSKSDST